MTPIFWQCAKFFGNSSNHDIFMHSKEIELYHKPAMSTATRQILALYQVERTAKPHHSHLFARKPKNANIQLYNLLRAYISDICRLNVANKDFMIGWKVRKCCIGIDALIKRCQEHMNLYKDLLPNEIHEIRYFTS